MIIKVNTHFAQKYCTNIVEDFFKKLLTLYKKYGMMITEKEIRRSMISGSRSSQMIFTVRKQFMVRRVSMDIEKYY
jgi:hypothetical protein